MNRAQKPVTVEPAATVRPIRKVRASSTTARQAKKRGSGRGQGNLTALMSSKWQHWTTPQKFLHRLYKLGKPALDPCSNFASRTGALQEFWGKHFEGEELNRVKVELEQAQASGRTALLRDGLVESWQGYVSFVYWNPPFKQLADWLKKGADERDQGVESVGLFPARTDTVAFHEQVFARANAGLFWRGRINFDNPQPPEPGFEDNKPPGSGNFPPFVAYYGDRIDDFFAAFDGAGELCRLNTRVYSEDEHVDG